jgi:hypothetical protein
MITCTFNGRLGNNLFQLATALSIANDLKTDTIFPETTWAGHRGHIPVDLSMFAYNFKRGVIQTTNSYNETQFHYESIEPIDDLTIHGFYQSDKYFNSIRIQLLNEYLAPSQNVLNQLSKYEISSNSLGISVRRGDYLMLQENHCVLSTEYYQESINMYFQNNVDQIFIFSDDIEWCRSIFGNEVNYVQDTPGVQLFLMSKMKHLILSNSTFAWWGAYLNNNDGIIVAPTPWFGPAYKDKDTKDIYCDNWIQLSHQIVKHPFNITPNMYE